MHEVQGYLLLCSFQTNQVLVLSSLQRFWIILPVIHSNTQLLSRSHSSASEVSHDCFTELEYYNVSSLIWFSELLVTHPHGNLHPEFVPFHCVYSQSLGLFLIQICYFEFFNLVKIMYNS